MVDDLIKTDKESGQLTWYPPVRGEEEEFLFDIREIATKTLRQQCEEYYNDEETEYVIQKSFQKLKDDGLMAFWNGLSIEERNKIVHEEVQYHTVSQVVIERSLSSLMCPVSDGSSRNKAWPDEPGGMCLSEFVVKGKISSLNLLKTVLQFLIESEDVQDDLKQFYVSINLQPWNLQKTLIQLDLNSDDKLTKAVIDSLTWGIECVSAQNEISMVKLADEVKEENPALADFILYSRFADDQSHSGEYRAVLKKLVKAVDNLFGQAGL